MKSVGKQLQEARLAKNWTPELAARETKIRVERVMDLEVDDYSHFSSPTYARGFVRTYARSLGLDEYRILRQLDNKLPEDDNASFANESGLPYVPEPSQKVSASSANRTGLYVVLGLGFAVMLISAFVLLQAYRAGELPRYFANSSPDTSTNAAPTNTAPVADADAPAHALPVDPNDTTHSVRAVPVDLNNLAATDTNAGPVNPVTGAAIPAPASPVTTSSLTASTAPATPAVPAVADETAPAVAPTSTPSPDAPIQALRALPVDPASLTNGAPMVATGTTAPPGPSISVTPPPAAPPETPAAISSTARASNNTVSTNTKTPPRALPVDPSELAASATPVDAPVNGAAGGVATDAVVGPGGIVTTPVDLSPTAPSATQGAPDSNSGKALVLTASRDSFVRVTSVSAQGQEVLYASVLRAGQSLAFGGRKFSVNVGIPSAVDIALDGVNYGPHSDRESPETFTLNSHQP